MPENTIIEAETVEEARDIAKSGAPKGFAISSEEIISDGNPVTIQSVAKTAEKALAKLQKKIPPGAEVIKQEEIGRPGERSMEIEAFDEEALKNSSDLGLQDFEAIKDVELIKKGSKGLLGINKKPNLYKVVISQRSKIEIVYQEKAKVKFTLDPMSLMSAVNGEDVETVKYVLEITDEPIDSRDESGYTPLMNAALNGNVVIVDLLLSKGADVNAATSWGETALSRAAQEGDVVLVDLLLKYGADPNAAEYDGYTPLSRAAMNGHIQAVEMLLAKGADTSIQTKHGHTALTLAMENGYSFVAEVLKK